jgi:hypothetical protein
MCRSAPINEKGVVNKIKFLSINYGNYFKISNDFALFKPKLIFSTMNIKSGKQVTFE